MKRALTALVLSAMLAGGGMTLQADMHKKMSPAEQQKHMQDKIDKMTKELQLTPDQQTKLHAILDQKMQKMKTAMDDANSQIRAMLGPNQLSKYNDMTD